MRGFAYFLLTFALCALAVVAIAGRRGGISRKPPIYVFPDMDRQLKLRPQNANGFFTNGFSSQLPVAGTVARSTPIQTANGPVYSFQDSPVNTGRIAGRTNFVENNPLPVTAQLLARGQQRSTFIVRRATASWVTATGSRKKSARCSRSATCTTNALSNYPTAKFSTRSVTAKV